MNSPSSLDSHILQLMQHSHMLKLYVSESFYSSFQ